MTENFNFNLNYNLKNIIIIYFIFVKKQNPDAHLGRRGFLTPSFLLRTRESDHCKVKCSWISFHVLLAHLGSILKITSDHAFHYVCFKAGQGCKSYSYRLQHISEEYQIINMNYGDIKNAIFLVDLIFLFLI